MTTCKACNYSLAASYRFCPNCGAKQVTERLTVWALIKSFFLKIFNFDFPFVRTVKYLLLKPEVVTQGYIDGVRKVFNPPVQFAVIVLSAYGLFQFLFADFLNLSLEQNFLSGFQEGYNNYDDTPNESYVQMNAIINWLQSRNQFLVFAMIPFIGWMSSLLYRKSGYNLAEHLVIAIYAVSFTLLLSVVIGLIMAPFDNLMAVQIYLNGSTILTILAISWVLYRSVRGVVLKPLGVILLACLLMLLIGFVVMIPVFAFVKS